ncbi:MAG: MarR family transcriptional regulator [Chloroflexi bacterium]|nr:MarR family transcriptional regulator [Chloroflexota bacterium]
MTDTTIDQPTLSASEEHEIWALLSHVRDGMITLRDRELRSVGISGVQGGVLWALHTLKKLDIPATPTELAERVFRRTPTTWAMVNRMEKQGLVRCVRSTQGRKQVLVEMTQKGEEVYRRFLEERRVIPRLLTSLAPEEREQLTTILAKLQDQINRELEGMPPLP